MLCELPYVCFTFSNSNCCHLATRLPDAIKPIMKQFNTTAIVELYNSVDLIGISSYACELPKVVTPGTARASNSAAATPSINTQ